MAEYSVILTHFDTVNGRRDLTVYVKEVALSKSALPVLLTYHLEISYHW